MQCYGRLLIRTLVALLRCGELNLLDMRVLNTPWMHSKHLCQELIASLKRVSGTDGQVLSFARMKRKAVCGCRLTVTLFVRSLMLAYQADAESHGARVALNTSIVAADVSGISAFKACFLCGSLDFGLLLSSTLQNSSVHAQCVYQHSVSKCAAPL